MSDDNPATDRPLLSKLTAADLWQRALTYRSMAASATTLEQHTALLRLAWRYEKLAMEKSGQ